MRVRHIAAMASGHDQETLGRGVGSATRTSRCAGSCSSRRTGAGHACSPTTSRAPTRWAASSSATPGLPLTEYLRPRLFDPLGIGPVGWQLAIRPPARPPARPSAGVLRAASRGPRTWPSSGSCTCSAASGTAASCSPADWVAQATVQAGRPTPTGTNPDWQQGYGFQFWMSRHGYRGDGAFGQFCVVLPEQDTVVATTAATLDMQAVLDALWEHLLPGLGRAGAGRGGGAAVRADGPAGRARAGRPAGPGRRRRPVARWLARRSPSPESTGSWPPG